MFAALVVFAAFAPVGAGDRPQAPPAGGTAAAKAPATGVEAHRKAVFDERRTRFEGKAKDRTAGGVAGAGD